MLCMYSAGYTYVKLAIFPAQTVEQQMPIHLEHHVSRLTMKISAMATRQRVTIDEIECIDCSWLCFENKLEA